MLGRCSRRVACVLILAAIPAGGLWAADWPTYRGDMARSGVTSEAITTPVHVQWTYRSPHPPQPAWPEPGRELHRMAFGYAYEPVVAGGMIYYGSSADHKVYALDLTTGHERWTFSTEGPVRFAPAVAEGRVFVGSDDGCLYCLSAGEGKLLWKHHFGPRDSRLMGNGQLVSRWPLRTGVAEENGIVYTTAGMWPGEGVYVAALRAEDGSVVWLNDESGSMYIAQPHPPSFAMTGVTPQGNIVVSDTQVFVPTGRNMPAAFDKATGKLLYYRGQPDAWGDRWGGAFAFAYRDLLFGGNAHLGPDIDVKPGESDPWPNDGIVSWTGADGKTRRAIPNVIVALAKDDTLYGWGSDRVSAFDLPKLLSGVKPADCTKWQTPHPRVYCMALASDTLIVGGRDVVTALSVQDGRELGKSAVQGQVRGLAVAEGKVLASTTAGEIVCLGAEAVTNPPLVASAPPPSVHPAQGYTVVLGGDEELIRRALASGQRVFCVEPSPARVALLRLRFGREGVYGTRVVVIEAPLNQLPLPDYLADHVLISRSRAKLADCSPAEAQRILRPGGGSIETEDGTEGAAWLAQGGALMVQTEGGRVSGVRGPLTGGADWTHQYADAGKSGASRDEVVKLPVEMLWFGDPGPGPLVSRHWGGPAPLCVGGRLFVIGQNSIMAVDAYNGRPLWTHEAAKVARYPVGQKGGTAVADGDSVYYVLGTTCTRLDAKTGQVRQTYNLPPPPSGESAEGYWWNYLSVVDDVVLGTMNKGEGRAVFAVGKDKGEAKWLFPAQETITQDAAAIDGEMVYVLDRTSDAAIDQAKRRGESIIIHGRLVALRLATGEVAWETDHGLTGRVDVRAANGAVLVTGGGRMTVFDALTGRMLSYSGVKMRGFPVIVGDTIYGEPSAYDLQTGAPRTRTHPLTGQAIPWDFRRSYGCGAVCGSANMLLFRSGTAGFYDTLRDSGIYNLGGVRAGCYVNAIVADGLLLMPPADAGCTCSYSYQTTVALVPTKSSERWSVFTAPEAPATQAIASLALNLGATGDRRDDKGLLWLAFPRPAGLKVPVEVQGGSGSGYYRRHADNLVVEGTDRPWLYASGLTGPATLKVRLGPADPKRYTVALHFAEVGDVQPGQRILDVKLQGQTAVEGLDIAAEAGEDCRALVKTITGVEATDTLTVELVARSGLPPILSAVELRKE
ncbi:MAG: methyltransferase domain-containing protein [Armatimonadetes bacterium]|nr:methyltransferase domain-containing protein [Armatimonadota bacterium]